jgi:hypothetical protein
MQTQTKAPAATPAPVTVTTVGPEGQTLTLVVPKTRSEVRDLVRQREVLSDQLTNVSERRSELSTELQGTVDPVARTGLEQRLTVLDKRILQLETDLANTGRQLASAPSALVSTAETDEAPGGGSDFAEGMAAGGFSVLLLSTVFFLVSRRRWKRRTRAGQPQLGSDASQRLERLEQGMEAIAIEIERVSEGQRFVTKLLSTRESAARTEAV